MCLPSTISTNPYPEKIDMKILNITIHRSGKNAEVFGYNIQENEAINEITSGIFSVALFDLKNPNTPVGNKKPLITRSSITKFNELYDCLSISFSTFPNNVLFLITAVLPKRDIAKIIPVIIAIVAIILFLLIKAYKMYAVDKTKPIILSESIEIIDNGKMVYLICLDTLGILAKEDKQKRAIDSANISL